MQNYISKLAIQQKRSKETLDMQKKASGGSTGSVVANEGIKALKMQVISESGENLGILSRDEAFKRAEALNLDVVLVANNGPDSDPVVRIMNLKKKLYDDKKKSVAAKKNQREVQTKEIRMGVKIGEHDFQTKMRQATQFLVDGDRVKVSLVFKGRERGLRDLFGVELLEKVSRVLQEGILPTGKALAHEKDIESQALWSRIYYLKKQ